MIRPECTRSGSQRERLYESQVGDQVHLWPQRVVMASNQNSLPTRAVLGQEDRVEKNEWSSLKVT
jgi:hypothetical protein